MAELRPELATLGLFIGPVGEASAEVTLIRQIQGERPEGFDRSYPARWFAMYYLAAGHRYDAGTSFDEILDHAEDTYSSEGFVARTLRRTGAICTSGMDFSRELRTRGLGALSRVVITDSVAPGNAVAVGKSEFVGRLVAVVQRSLLKVLPAVEKEVAVMGALETISRKAPPKPKDAAFEETPAGEDPVITALMLALWKAEQLPANLGRQRDEDNYETYSPLG